jgi:hypothetical protein
MLVGREAEGFDDAPFNRMEGWGPDCHEWTGASTARPAEKCGPTIICPPNPFGTLHLLTCLARVFQRSHSCKIGERGGDCGPCQRVRSTAWLAFSVIS